MRKEVCIICKEEFDTINSKMCSTKCKRIRYAQKQKSYMEKYNKDHKEDRESYYRTYYINKSDECKERSREAGYLNKYGITIEDFNKMLIEQDKKCLICGRTAIEAGKRRKHLSVDHCHKTGKVRGLLCIHCNTGLGAFDDNIDRLELAMVYLNANL